MDVRSEMRGCCLENSRAVSLSGFFSFKTIAISPWRDAGFSESEVEQPLSFAQFPVARGDAIPAIHAGDVPLLLSRRDVHEAGFVAAFAIGAR